MGFFSPGELADFRFLADSAMPDTAAIYRPDYAGAQAPAGVATVRCRVTRFPTSGGDVVDVTGDASHTIHLPEGTDVRPGDEILVNGTRRYLVLPTNDGRSYQYDVQVAARRET